MPGLPPGIPCAITHAHFLSGDALGMDMFAAEAAPERKETFPWIVLEMVGPFDAQAARWSEEHRI